MAAAGCRLPRTAADGRVLLGVMPDPSSPASIATASFDTARRGFDQTAVRGFLSTVSDEMARRQATIDDLRGELEQAQTGIVSLKEQLVSARHVRPEELDEATVASLLGEEAARLLTTAREGAGQIRNRATLEADDLRASTTAEMSQMRSDAIAECVTMRETATADADRSRIEAQNEAGQAVADAKSEGRDLALEARAYRERVLADLARRRELVERQLELLHIQRARLRASFSTVRTVLDDITIDLDGYDAELPTPYEDPQSITGRFPTVAAMVAAQHDESVAVEAEPELEPVESEPEVVEPDEPELESVEPDEAESEVVEPEPEPDSAHVVAKADDLFARIRAGRVDETPLATVPSDVESAEPTDDILDLRRAALGPIEANMARHIKRALADEQSALLDALRRASSVAGLDALVGDPDQQSMRYRIAATLDVEAAAQAGLCSLVANADPAALASHAVVDRALDALVSELVAPLRERLDRCLLSASGDANAAGDSVRALYREFKVQRIDTVSAHIALLAHGRGALASVAQGTALCWLVDPLRPCAEGDDNVLGGSVAAGEAFPTGHSHTPAYVGCRCVLVLG